MTTSAAENILKLEHSFIAGGNIKQQAILEKLSRCL